MGRCRIVQPETVRLELGSGEDAYWVEIKKRLSVGEKRKATAVVAAVIQGGFKPDMDALGGKAQVMAYLVDWNLRDSQDKPLVIDTDGKKAAILDALDEETFEEISNAIEAHAEAQKKADATERKNVRSGELSSSPTLQSVGS